MRLIVFLAVIAGCVIATAEEPSFELRDGDRVVLLGGTLIERAQRYGWIETALTAAFPDRNVTFRNLGWSGDTVWAESRGIFETPEVGYRQMIEHIETIRPTEVILGYGNNESFAGEQGLPQFIEQYEKLLDDVTGVSDSNVRFVFLSPIPMERRASPLPDPSDYDRRVKLYSDAIQHLAEKRKARFVDLYAKLDNLWKTSVTSQAASRMTTNGIHFTSEGYAILAAMLVHELIGSSRTEPANDPSRLPTDASLEVLRQAINKKNEFYFHHWRPQNVTYLFLFRKHEQGQNAAEVAEFQQLVAAKEADIARLRNQLNEDVQRHRTKDESE